MTVGARLKELRERKGVTQFAAAQVVGVRPMTISRWERGEFAPRSLAITQLAAYYGASVEWIVTGEITEPRVENVDDVSGPLQSLLESFDPDDPHAPSDEEVTWLQGLSFREMRSAGLDVTPQLLGRLLRERRSQDAGKTRGRPKVVATVRPGRKKLGKKGGAGG